MSIVSLWFQIDTNLALRASVPIPISSSEVYSQSPESCKTSDSQQKYGFAYQESLYGWLGTPVVLWGHLFAVTVVSLQGLVDSRALAKAMSAVIAIEDKCIFVVLCVSSNNIILMVLVRCWWVGCLCYWWLINREKMDCYMHIKLVHRVQKRWTWRQVPTRTDFPAIESWLCVI